MPTITSDALVDHAATVVRERAAPRDREFLLALLMYAPSEKGRLNIANKIIHVGNGYVGEQEHWAHLQQLSDFYWRHIILPGAFELFSPVCLLYVLINSLYSARFWRKDAGAAK